MFHSILIANRGEIACRIIQACRDLNIRSIAIASEFDNGSLHTRRADTTVVLPGTTLSESYLNVEGIIQAAQTHGAEAIHPGYGFLSENADFARAVQSAGLVFIGPRPETIELMGDKIASRALALSCNVPMLPWVNLNSDTALCSTSPLDSLSADVRSDIERLTYPLLVKAAQGGGGRGMRVVTAPENLNDALTAAARESQMFFGSSSLFIERYIPCGRHVEVQILADSQGAVMTLSGRECSFQRRHQKLIEEAPPENFTGLPEMLAAAEALATTSGYTNAGTVEFLVDENGDFFFLEVNSRLQVEHPVSEEISGIDLVCAQINVAAGIPLAEAIRADPDSIQIRGHAIECRICAEVPEDDFRAATGTITRLRSQSHPDLRLDSGFESGDTVSHHYDSLLCKLIAKGTSRAEAQRLLIQTLEGMEIFGVRTNIGFLLRLLKSKEFTDQTHHIHLAEQLLPDQTGIDSNRFFAAALSAVVRFHPSLQMHPKTRGPWSTADSWRMSGAATSVEQIAVDGQLFRLQITTDSGSSFFISEQERGHTAHITVSCWRESSFDYLHADAALSCTFRRSQAAGATWITSPSGPFLAKPAPRTGVGGCDTGQTNNQLSSPLPGTIISIHAGKEEIVAAGQKLIVIESMKMEHPLYAPVAAKISSITVKPGDIIDADTPLLILDPIE